VSGHRLPRHNPDTDGACRTKALSLSRLTPSKRPDRRRLCSESHRCARDRLLPPTSEIAIYAISQPTLSNMPSSAQIPIGRRIMCVCQRNEQKPIEHSEKLIYSTRSRRTVHHRIRGKNPARTSTKPPCGKSKRLPRSINPSSQSAHKPDCPAEGFVSLRSTTLVSE
jgi:hypothetical protein